MGLRLKLTRDQLLETKNIGSVTEALSTARSATGDKKHRLRYRGSLNSAIAYWKKQGLALPGLSTARSRTGKNTNSPYPDSQQRDRAPHPTKYKGLTYDKSR